MIVNGYEIKPGADLTFADLKGANLAGANGKSGSSGKRVDQHQHRHSSESWNPVRSVAAHCVAYLRFVMCTTWIPACAGMTNVEGNVYP